MIELDDKSLQLLMSSASHLNLHIEGIIALILDVLVDLVDLG